MNVISTAVTCDRHPQCPAHWEYQKAVWRDGKVKRFTLLLCNHCTGIRRQVLIKQGFLPVTALPGAREPIA